MGTAGFSGEKPAVFYMISLMSPNIGGTADIDSFIPGNSNYNFIICHYVVFGQEGV
jgi:hypothetical protein